MKDMLGRLTLLACQPGYLWLNTPTAKSGALAAPASLYDFSALQYEKPVSFDKFSNCVCVVVNVRTFTSCMFTLLLLDNHSMVYASVVQCYNCLVIASNKVVGCRLQASDLYRT